LHIGLFYYLNTPGTTLWSWDSSVSIVTSLWAGQPGSSSW